MDARQSDLLLAQRVADTNDSEAFTEIVRRYQGLVYGVCLRVLGNPADAEDVAQDCFLRFARKAGTVKTSPGGWLHRQATFLSIDALRSRAARTHKEQEYAEMKRADDCPAPWEEVAPHLDQALDELPDELRHVLAEHFLRQRTQEEIAEELGVSQGTVSRRIAQGIEALQGKLKKAGVVISMAALGSLLTEKTAVAVPQALTASLGKMAMAMATQGAGAAATGGAVATAAATCASGGITLKIIATVAVACGLAAGGVFVVLHAVKPVADPTTAVAAAGQSTELSTPAPRAEPTGPQPLPPKTGVDGLGQSLLGVKITGERVSHEVSANIIHFEGHVKVTRGDTTITCDRLDASAPDEMLTAAGGVSISATDWGAFAEKAVFDLAADVVTLTGTLQKRPSITWNKDGKPWDKSEAERITYSIRDRRTLYEGDTAHIPVEGVQGVPAPEPGLKCDEVARLFIRAIAEGRDDDAAQMMEPGKELPDEVARLRARCDLSKIQIREVVFAKNLAEAYIVVGPFPTKDGSQPFDVSLTLKRLTERWVVSSVDLRVQ